MNSRSKIKSNVSHVRMKFHPNHISNDCEYEHEVNVSNIIMIQFAKKQGMQNYKDVDYEHNYEDEHIDFESDEDYIS